MSKGTVYIVDDDASVREGLGLLLAISGFSIEAFENGTDFLACKLRSPGCVVLDMRMEGLSGQQVLEALQRRGNSLPVLVITAYGDIPSTVRAMQCGARDLITKPVDGTALVAQIEQLVGENGAAHETDLKRDSLARCLAQLTLREREVLSLAAAGLDTYATAQRLGISLRTVEGHRSHIVGKTGVPNLSELFRLSARLGVALP